MEDWTSNKEVLCQRFDTEGHGWAREMQAVCMKVVASSSVASPKFFWEGQWLKRATVFYLDISYQGTKWQDMLEFRWNGSIASLATPMVTRKEWKRKSSTFLMFDIPDKNSQQRKTARHCRFPTKRNIVSIGCYVWLLSTRLPLKQKLLVETPYAYVR